MHTVNGLRELENGLVVARYQILTTSTIAFDVWVPCPDHALGENLYSTYSILYRGEDDGRLYWHPWNEGIEQDYLPVWYGGYATRIPPDALDRLEPLTNERAERVLGYYAALKFEAMAWIFQAYPHLLTADVRYRGLNPEDAYLYEVAHAA